MLVHLNGFAGDIELIHKTMESLNIGMINLRHSMENIDIKFEMKTVGVLKDVFVMHEEPGKVAAIDGVAANINQEPVAEDTANLNQFLNVGQDIKEQDGHG